jgi:hypothetical protein
MNKFLERVDDRHFWNPGVFSYAIIPRCHLNSRVFFFIVLSIVYEDDPAGGQPAGHALIKV